MLLFSRFGPKTLLGLARNAPLQQKPIINKGPFSGKLIPRDVPLQTGMEKNGNKNAIRGDLTRGFEFLKYQVKRVTSCELLEENNFF